MSTPVPSNVQQKIQIPPNTTAVTVTLTTLQNGYVYALPLAEGWPAGVPFPGRYGGQFQIGRSGPVCTPNGSTGLTFAPGDAANVTLVLQRIGSQAASAKGKVTFTGATAQPVTVSLAVPATTDSSPPVSTKPPVQKTAAGAPQPLGVLRDGTVVLSNRASLCFATWPAPGGALQPRGCVVLNAAANQDPGYAIQAVAQLANGYLVAATGNPGQANSGEIWVSPGAGKPFSCLLPAAMGFSSAFPIAVNGNVAVLGEYYPIDYAGGGYDGATRVWQVDTEVTPTEIMDITPPTELMQDSLFHHHGIAWDPYEELYWLVTGDGPTSRTVLVRDAAEGTWYQAAGWGQLPMQATNVVPMPGFVLFLSDEAQVAAMRYDRAAGGTVALLKQGKPLPFQVAWTLQAPWTVQSVPLSTVPALVAGDPPAAYWGWQVAGDVMPPGAASNPLPNLVTTRDGVHFYQVALGLPAYKGSGVQGVFGPDANGRVLAAVATGSGSARWTAVEFSHADVWGA